MDRMNSKNYKQLDFWPDQASPHMVALARLSHVAKPPARAARSGSEDGACGRLGAAPGGRLGNPAPNPDSFFRNVKNEAA